MHAVVTRLCLLLASVAVAAGAGCGRSGAKPADAGADAHQDAPAGFSGNGGAVGGGAAGGTAGGPGGAASVSGAAAQGGGAGSAAAGGAAAIGAMGGASGSSGSAGATGGAGVPLFPCIEDWPARPAGVQKSASLQVQASIRWTKALPSATAAAPVARGMAVTGGGVAFAAGYTLLVYDGEGNLVASVAKPQTALMSSPVAGPDGTLYFADSMAAYCVDALGRPIWQKTLGAKQTTGDRSAPRSPALDPAGRLLVSAMDGNLWTFRAEDGEVLSSVSLGIWQNGPRYINVGFGSILVVDRSGIAAAGSSIGAYGFWSVVSNKWLGEVLGDGLYVLGGYDLGVLVARGSEPSELSIYDTCGTLRWRVPGSYAVPLAITFDDDLIVMDRTPTGAASPNDHSFALRRFSKDGVLRAGPVSVSDQFCGNSFVGADDTFYYSGGASDGYRLRAFDASLNEIWVIPFPFCPDAAVLAEGGKIFVARAGQVAAVQTTSPGAARVSWAQIGRDARGTRWLAP